MQQTTQITIEHKVVISDKSYEQIIEEFEEQLGQQADWAALQQLIETNSTFEQALQLVEQHLGKGGFTILSKIEPGALLTILGKPT